MTNSGMDGAREAFEKAAAEMFGGDMQRGPYGNLLDRDSHFKEEYKFADVHAAWRMFQQGAARQASQSAGEGWISVDERLPAKLEDKFPRLVLLAVVGRDTYPEVGWLNDDGLWQSIETAPQDEPIYFYQEQVTHWRALPSPPKEKL